MSLCDVLKPVMTEELYVMFNYPIKHEESKSLQSDIEAFLKSGGKIDCVGSSARTLKVDALKERSDAQRATMLVADKKRLIAFHKEGLYLHIKYVKKTKHNDEGFRSCCNGINLGVRARLDDAILIKTTP